MATNEEITRHEDVDPDDDPWVGGPSPAEPIAVVDYEPAWPAVFEVVAGRVRDALGDRVLGLEHVGSTSVPGLDAKPVIDIDLTVVDSSDEAAYVPHWRGWGSSCGSESRSGTSIAVSRGTIRERTSTSGARTAPRRSATGCSGMASRPSRGPGPLRRGQAHVSRSVECRGESMLAYNQRKQPVIRDILDRMFRAHDML